MDWKWSAFGIALAIVVLGLIIPVGMWDGSRPLTLTLSGRSLAAIESLSYRSEPRLDAADYLRDRYPNEDVDGLIATLEPVRLGPDGTFTVEARTHGTMNLFGLSREGGMNKYVLLMARLKTGEVVFRCVSVLDAAPIDLTPPGSSAPGSVPTPGTQKELDRG